MNIIPLGRGNPDLRMTLQAVTPPVNTPLLLADVKAHLRVLSSAEDQLILSLMAVATAMLDGKDGILGRALLTQTWDCWLDWNFPPDIQPIEIPLGPLQSVTFINYADPNTGVMTPVDASRYTVDTYSARSRILTAYNQYWPPVRWQVNTIQIRGVFGFGDTANAVPDPIKQALLLMIGHLYENREETTSLSLSVLPRAVDHLLAPYKIRRF